jgi:hypothetical protein
MTAPNTKTSPLKEKARRQAGQSVDEQLDVLVNDKILMYLVVAVLVVMIVGLEWYRWYFPAPAKPIFSSMIALLVATVCVFRVRSFLKEARNLKQGRDGERLVGEFLERLRETGAVVFHDIVAGSFNIDHVVISEKGVFVIETKTFSKPHKDARVHVDGATMRIDGLGDQTRILEQVKANARWVREMLKQSTGRDFQPKPVVLFPGWYVEGGAKGEVWVLNPKGLPTFIGNAPQQIPLDDVRLASFHLSRFIRATG